MRMIQRHSRSLLLCGVVAGCAAPSGRSVSVSVDAEPRQPVAVYREVAGTALGEPLAVSVDFAGTVYVADGAPGRIVSWLAPGTGSLEFQRPAQQPGFYPGDIKTSGFFVYALDPDQRTLLRFDNRGAYRDVLIKFDELAAGRRIIPAGLDVDPYGRIAVADAANHRVIVFDAYLAVELVFGNYGSSAGQFDGPEGVAFTSSGGFVVTDTGNRRIQLFDAGGKFTRSLPGGEANPLVKPRRAVADKSGTVYVADPEARRVFVFAADGTLSHSLVPANVTDFRPTDIEIDASHAIYVTDAGSASVFVFK
jgi:DNA-binding beta-propeller fold protein YncE